MALELTVSLNLTFSRDPSTAATVKLGRDGNVYIDPYTGAMLGTGSPRTNEFFQMMTSWHRYMGSSRTREQPRSEASRLAALRAHRRAWRSSGANHCRPGLSGRRLPRLHGPVARLSPIVELVALEASPFDLDRFARRRCTLDGRRSRARGRRRVETAPSFTEPRRRRPMGLGPRAHAV